MRNVLIQGMHGMGDNLHQRGLVRLLLADGDNLFLETPWPSLYHDLVGPRLRLVNKRSVLRTQAKNAIRERAAYRSVGPLPRGTMIQRVWYSAEEVRKQGSVFAAMISNANRDPASADFRIPVPEAWQRKAQTIIAQWNTDKPIMFLRPLVERTEWKGCAARNPDPLAYRALYESICEQFFVVSIADLVPGKEWIWGPKLQADIEYHAGEFEVEVLLALAQASSLVFASPGFATIMAEAVGTPSVCVFGGYENASSFSGGARFAPYLGIDPINSCQCFSHNHNCDKRIDMALAIPRLAAFIKENCNADSAAGPRDTAVGRSIPHMALRPRLGVRPKRSIWGGADCSADPRAAGEVMMRPSVKVQPQPIVLPSQVYKRFFNAGELERLIFLMRMPRPKVVVEFGCHDGRAALALLSNIPSIEKYIGVDVLPGYVTVKECQRKEIPDRPGHLVVGDPRFQLVLRPRGSFDLQVADLPRCDAVFIDADHSRAGVLNDFQLAEQLVNPGGIIVFHDDNRLPVVEVSETLDELHDAGTEIVHVDDTWLAFHRVEETTVANQQ
jgi:predicted O-methyltransferase YrrM